MPSLGTPSAVAPRVLRRALAPPARQAAARLRSLARVGGVLPSAWQQGVRSAAVRAEGHRDPGPGPGPHPEAPRGPGPHAAAAQRMAPAGPLPGTAQPLLDLLERLSAEVTAADRDSQLANGGRLFRQMPQASSPMQRQGHGQGQREGHGQAQGEGEGEGQWQSQRQGERQGQGQRQREGQVQRQREGQGQAQRDSKEAAAMAHGRSMGSGDRAHGGVPEIAPWRATPIAEEAWERRSPLRRRRDPRTGLRDGTSRAGRPAAAAAATASGHTIASMQGGQGPRRGSSKASGARPQGPPQRVAPREALVSRKGEQSRGSAGESSPVPGQGQANRAQGQEQAQGRGQTREEGAVTPRPGTGAGPDSAESGPLPPLPGGAFPFHDFVHSYSETPRVAPLGFREPPFSPFGPAHLETRPWTGGPPLPGKKSGRGAPGEGTYAAPALGGAQTEMGAAAEDVQGAPLTDAEVDALVAECAKDKRQVNLGRDGVVHNMLELVHTHWKRRPVCRVRCKGVPTVDMDNVARTIEERTGGCIIRRAGGVLYVFRGRHYSYRERPRIPLMLWKPPAPIYPRLVEDPPPGLTREEADILRRWGRRVPAVCRLAKNGVYLSLVQTVRETLQQYPLCKVDCRGLDKSDYKKVGAKLRDLVPCVLLSFEKEQILMWQDGPGKRRPQVPSQASGDTEVEGAELGIAKAEDTEDHGKEAEVENAEADITEAEETNANATLSSSKPPASAIRQQMEKTAYSSPQVVKASSTPPAFGSFVGT